MPGDDNSGVFVGFPPSQRPVVGGQQRLRGPDRRHRRRRPHHRLGLRLQVGRHRRPRRRAEPAGRVEHLRAAGRGRAAAGLPQRRADQRLHQHRPGPLAAPGTSASRTTAPATTSRSATSGSRSWAAPPPTGTGPIVGLAGKCLDVSGGSSADGTKIQLWTCNGTGAQQWTVAPGSTIAGAGQVPGRRRRRHRRRHQGAAVDLQRHRRAELGRRRPTDRCATRSRASAWTCRRATPPTAPHVHLWTCHGGANQRWRLPA